MPAVDRYTHEFVELIPAELEDGMLYVSVHYATTVHLCACGCDTKVVCPLSPTDYVMLFDGETVGLSPSIGNWSFYCQSHYFIRHGRVVWMPSISPESISAGRQRDRATKQAWAQGSQYEDDPRYPTQLTTDKTPCRGAGG